jgi:glycosyltransferase involved in cell wall biosynthesis
MLVSVIIPAYNAAKTIEKTIQSVLDQDYPSIEIIVVNDGSTDTTEDILKKYSSKIRYLYQANAGVSTARNNAYSHAKGAYIQYLDADDLLAPSKITTQVKLLEEQNADVAYGDWVKFTETEHVYKELELVSREMQAREEIELFTDFWVPLAALLYKRSITDKIGNWNTKLPIIQDARYALDAALHKAKFLYTPGVMAYYRVHDSGSLSTKNKLAFMLDCFENAKQIYSLWQADIEKDVEKKNALIKVLRFCVNEFSILDKLKHGEAIDCILKIEPNYIPDGSKGLRTMSKLFGYRNAERLASIKRRIS